MKSGAAEKIIALKYPFDFAGKRIESITLKRLKAKHLKGFGVSGDGKFDVASTISIIAKSSNLEEGLIEELDAADYVTLSSEVSDFL